MNDSSNRVKGDMIAIDPKKLKDFFEGRGSKVSVDSPYTSILYQDDNPAVAYQRDEYEKKKIKPLLGLTNCSRVLDIGCGIGRWADALLDDIAEYIGVDFSESLAEQARARMESTKVKFLVLSADEVCASTVTSDADIDLVIISGVLLYLNDQQVVKCFKGISELLGSGATIYLREPLGIFERLTLNGYWSEELGAEYCAIYRTEEQLTKLIKEATPAWRNIEIEFTPLYEDDSLNNRNETKQFYSILKIN